MKENSFNVLFGCIVASFVALAGATFASLPHGVVVTGGVGPLVYYHWFYLRPRAKIGGLSQSAIDSVYYFGFLVTVSALGISAITIAQGGVAGKINTVLFQFGVGLFATGYAVVARMHLSSLSVALSDTNPEALMDRYIKRSMELVDNVDMASLRMSEFAQTIMMRTTEISDTARVQAERAMLDVARAFENEMKGTLALAKEGIIEVRGLVADTLFVAEREELLKSVRATVTVTTELNKAMGDFTTVSRAAEEATQTSIIKTKSLAESLTAVHSNLAELASPQGAVAKSAKSLVDAANAMDEGAVVIRSAVNGIAEAAVSVADTGPTFQKMRTVAKKAYEQLEAVSGISEKMDQSLTGIREAATATSTLATELDRVTKSLPVLSASAEALALRLSDSGRASASIDERLSVIPKQVERIGELSDAVTAKLNQIADAIDRTAQTSEQLTGNAEESLTVLRGAREFLTATTGLHGALATLQNQIQGLTESAGMASTTLKDSSSDFKASMAATTEALQDDIESATKATGLLTDRLVQVAQTIIDRTRRQEEVTT